MSETPGHYWYRTRLDYDRGMAEVERALASRPGESDFVALTGYILRRKGETRAAVDRFERAAELAPRDANAHDIVCETWLLLRVYERARPACEWTRELQPDLFHANSMLAQIEIGEAGDTAAARRWLTEEVDAGSRQAAAYENFELYDLALLERDPGAALEAARAFGDGAINSQFRYLPTTLAEAFAHRLAGNAEAARAAFETARLELQAVVDADPDEPRYRSAFGLALAGLGRNEEAIREGEAGLRLMPPEKEAWRGAWRMAELARIEAMTGRHDEAIERLAYLLSVPSDLSVWSLRLDPAWDPLRANPRFEALVAEE